MNLNDLEQLARFWSHVDVISHSNSDQCWIWTGAKNNKGYGVFGKNPILAHRFVASQTQTIDNKTVNHLCDNPGCVKPSHLVIGTQKQNVFDMYLKQRNNSKLDIQSVKDIRTKRLSRLEFSKLYDVSEFTIGQVQRKETWTWVN